MPLPTTTNTTLPKAAGLDILIESNYFQIAASPDRPFDVQEAAGQIRAADQFIANPEDLPRDESLALSQVDFSGGEGLDFAHRPDNTDFDKTRFWASEGIRVVAGHGTVQKLQLESEFAKIHDQTDFQTSYRQSQQMVAAGGSLFVIGNAGDNTLITRIDDPAMGRTPTSASEDPHGGAGQITSLAEINGEVFASVEGDGLYKRTSGGTWSRITTVQPRRIWGAKGRLIATDSGGDDIQSIETDGTAPGFIALLPDNEQVLCATDASAAILVGVTNGYLYALADIDGTLTLRAQTPFKGEEVTAVGAGPSGIVLVGTRSGPMARLYMGELSEAYTVVNMQLLGEWDSQDFDQSAISHIAFLRDEAFFAFENADGDRELWRFDATTTGLFRVHVASGGEGVTGMAVVDDRLFFSDRVHDVYGEQATYQTSGWLISPLFDHFDAEDKVWAAAKFFGVSFPAGTSATLYYSTDPDAIEDDSHASWTSVKTLNATSGVDDTETLLAEASSRWVALKMELSTSAIANSPQVRGYSVRAYPGPGDVTMRIPVNVSDYVLRPGRQATRIDGFGLTRYDQLKSYEGTSVTLKWLYTDETFEGTVKQVGTRVPLVPRRGSPLLISQVEFVGRRV